MNEILLLLLIFCWGILLGLFFYGGLRWTVRKSVNSSRPTLLFLSSLVFRSVLTVAGFFYIAGLDWRREVACALGFIFVRVTIVRKARWKEGESVNRMDL